MGLGWQDTINNNGKVWQRPLVVTRDTAQRGINGRYARVQKVHLANKMINLDINFDKDIAFVAQL